MKKKWTVCLLLVCSVLFYATGNYLFAKEMNKKVFAEGNEIMLSSDNTSVKKNDMYEFEIQISTEMKNNSVILNYTENFEINKQEIIEENRSVISDVEVDSNLHQLKLMVKNNEYPIIIKGTVLTENRFTIVAQLDEIKSEIKVPVVISGGDFAERAESVGENQEESIIESDGDKSDSSSISNLRNNVEEARITQNVSTWAEFITALGSPNVAVINIVASFATPSNSQVSGITTGYTNNVNGSYAYVYMNKASIARSVVIEGNSKVIDFGAVALGFTDITMDGVGAWDITWKDMTIYHGNWYGFSNFTNLSVENQRASAMKYNNVTNFGNQMQHSLYANVFVSGKTSNIQMPTYTSPFRENWRIYNTNQANLEISNLTVLKNSEFTIESIDSGNIDLVNGGTLTLQEGSKLNVKRNGGAVGEAGGTNLQVSKGNILLEENASLNLIPGANRSAISLQSSNSKLDIRGGAVVNVNSVNHTNNYNGMTYNLVYLAANSMINVGSGATFDVTATGMGSASSNIVQVAGSIDIKENGNVSIKSDSTNPNQKLLFFDNAFSKLSLDSVNKFNLQRTGTISGTSVTNGLIGWSGSNGEINGVNQNGKMWGKNNLQESATKNWKLLSNFKINYSDTTLSTVNSVMSISPGVADDFKTNFSTRNVQRILFEGTAVPPSGLSVIPKNVALEKNATQQLSWTFRPEDTTNKEVGFRNTDPSVISVDSKGLVTGLKAGTARVYVYSIANSSITAFSDIIVNEKIGEVSFLYQDLNGKKLAPDKVIKGFVGELFNEKPIEINGYRNDSLATIGNPSGIITEVAKQITFIYSQLELQADKTTLDITPSNVEEYNSNTDDEILKDIMKKANVVGKDPQTGSAEGIIVEAVDNAVFDRIRKLTIGVEDIELVAKKGTLLSNKVVIHLVFNKGTVQFSSVPKEMSFKNEEGMSFLQNLPVKIDKDLTILDTRISGSLWRIQASATNFKRIDGKQLIGKLTYINNENEKIIVNESYQTIQHGVKEQGSAYVNLSNKWSKEKGMVYSVPTGNYFGSYTGKVKWVLNDAP